MPEGALRGPLEKAVGHAVPGPIFQLLNVAIEKLLEPSLRGVTMLTDYPYQTICLARRQPERPYLVERFEVFVDNVEIAHGFVDCMDPSDVWARMRENGPAFTDEPFVRDLRDGLYPPSAGLGLGIERLLLVGGHITDVRDGQHLSQFRDYPPARNLS